MTYRLQIRTRNGQLVLNQLTPNSTLRELKLLSAQVTDIHEKCMKIFHGYPPKPLQSVSDLDTLASLSLRSGDTLIIEEDANSVADDSSSTNTSEPLGNDSRNQMQPEISCRTNGILTKRVVPADNSCLFTSIDFVMENGKKIDLESGRQLRHIIAQIVAGDPNLYNPGFLERSNSEYCSWISDNRSWGGAIEVSILANYFQTEIDVIDSETGRIDRFGEDKQFRQRVFLLYSGVHYDPIVLENFDGTSIIQTKFDVTDEEVLVQALEIGEEAKASRQFTNIESGTMKCLVCSVLVRGQLGLKRHLMETGHVNFSEI